MPSPESPQRWTIQRKTLVQGAYIPLWPLSWRTSCLKNRKLRRSLSRSRKRWSWVDCRRLCRIRTSAGIFS